MKSSIRKLREKLEDTLKIYDFNAIVIGADAQEFLQNNYFFTEQIENIHNLNQVQVEKSELLIIVGHPNLNLVERIKGIHALMKSKETKLIHISGGLSQKLQEKSYFVCEELSEHLPIDLTITKYPLNTTEIIQHIRKCMRDEEVIK
ncbi:MAG: hypothetical protein CME62_17850 [Halobacteriovoraceae bacterium]|nr:hypothetical protein [Halobacteriovoraceae bacterium]|tara:strand:- start:15122 stop:15562 length:441 start_codon:yes stop_codon:yes gene_type:complete